MRADNCRPGGRRGRLAVGLIPVGLLVPVLMLNGQDVPARDGPQMNPPGSPEAAPPAATPKASGWHPRTPGLGGNPPPPSDAPAVHTSGWQRRTVTGTPGLNPAAPTRPDELVAPGPFPAPGAGEAPAGPVITTLHFQKPAEGAVDEAQLTPEQRALLGAARAAVARGELRQAMIRFQEYLRGNPKDTKVRREYTGILIRAKELTQAIEQYELLIKDLPEDADVHLGLANVLLQLGRPKQAIPHLLIALKGAPDNTETAAQLARAYLGINEPRNARQVFERYLSGLKPGDAQVPGRLGRILLDLNRPKQAIPYLLALREKKPDDLELLAELIRAKAWLGQREEASQLITDLAGKEPQDVRLRLTLADALYRLSEYPLAAAVYSQVLRAEPQHLVALIGMARVNTQAYDVQPAADFLSGCQDETAQPELLALARGELYLAVGKYAEAVQVLRGYLARDEDDVDCRATLAKVYEATQDYEKAEAEWCKIGLLKGQDERSAVGVALILATQWRFAESNAYCERVLADEPESYKAVAQLVHNYGKMKKVDEAVARANAYLDSQHEDEHGPVVVGLALGRMLLEAHHFAEAVPVYEKLLATPLGQVSAAYFGLYYAQEHLHGDGQPHETLRPALEGTLRERMELADVASGFNDNELIGEICGAVLAKDPHHLPSLLRLGEAELRQASHDANIHGVVATCKVILELSPTNVRGRFILARAFALAQQYGPAFLEYDKLLKTDANLLQAHKELARTLYSANSYQAGHEEYEVAKYPTGDEALQNAVGRLTPREPVPHGASPLPPLPAGAKKRSPKEATPAPRDLPAPRALPLTDGGADGPVDATDQEEDCRRKLRRVEIDAEARAAEVKALGQEQHAKSLKDLRNHEAVDAYLNLLASQPDNTSAMFDLSEMFGALNLTRAAIGEAAQLLDVEPYNRDAQVVADKATALLRPHVLTQVDLFSENGRNGLARIESDKYTVQAICPFGDEGDFVGVGYSRIALVPHDDAPLVGNIGTLLFGKQITDRLTFVSQTNYEEFPNRFSDRPTGDATLSYDVTDCWRAYLGGYLRNVEENGESLRQDIYRGGMELGSYFHATRELDATAWYRLSGYSDNNVEQEAYLRASYRFLPPPFELKFLSSAQYTTFKETNLLSQINGNTTGNLLPGTRHPYFAPSKFWYFVNRVSFKHTLSRDLFKYSDQCFYQLEYALGLDDRGAIYNGFRVTVNYDVNNCVRLGAGANTLISSVYNAGAGFAFVEVWIPPAALMCLLGRAGSRQRPV